MPASLQDVADTGAQPEKGETMTTLENRPKTALLVVDVQNGVVEGAPERDAVVANVGVIATRTCIGPTRRRRAGLTERSRPRMSTSAGKKSRA
jgi:hypothetical protein